jgi:uncharacterized membrane protein
MHNTAAAGKTNRLVGIGIFIAIVVILQSFATYVNFITPGTIPIALVLPPIVIGAALYGAKVGALLGASFGTVVLFSGITGMAPLSAAMWGLNPVLMLLVTLGRGAAIGLAAGCVYTLLAKKNVYIAVMAAAVTAPVVNTGIFISVMALFFRGLMGEFTGLGSALVHAFTVFITINFVIELAVNIILAPAIVRLIKLAAKRA